MTLPIAEPNNTLEAARAAYAAGWSIIPLKGKRPAISSWKAYQETRPTDKEVKNWAGAGLLETGFGIVCGAVSANLVVLDLDGPAAYPSFAALFPKLAETFTVTTGSGEGKHVYLIVEDLPPTTRALDTPIGHLELRSTGTYVVGPTSVHPVTRNRYVVEKELPIQQVPNLKKLVEWIEDFKPVEISPEPWKPPRDIPSSPNEINPSVITAIADTLRGGKHRERGPWINCSCVYPERHKHGDRHPSFGFNTQSGYGYCYSCGTILAKDLCDVLGIDPVVHGGLMAPAPAPDTTLRATSHPDLVVMPKQREVGSYTVDPPADLLLPDAGLPAIGEIEVPAWLKSYTGWASAAGNQTPVTFHQASGIWLLAVAIARRLVVNAPWGVRLYPNLYMMFVADTTFYRKTTAFKLAESVIREAIPHMLMPTPGSPERFQDALAGKLPSNFKDLAPDQQELLRQAQAFAAQRGLFKDEVAGLFGSFNKKDYMVGLKDLIMELYDCPDYADKDTQSGLTVVRQAALSILGVTTPSGLSTATSSTDWDNGLLPRFLMLTPEPDYKERPTLTAYQPAPPEVAAGLKALYERLPMPTRDGERWINPDALTVDVQCWPEVQAYSDRLRRLCDPNRDTPLDDRLKGLYGRMHVQAIKLAMILSAMDWVVTDKPKPTVTVETWQTAETLAEHWRASAHRLIDQIERSGSGREERRQQDRVLDAIKAAGPEGITLRRMYRNLNLKSADARMIVHELVRDGQLAMTTIGSAEACRYTGYLSA